MKDLTNKEFFEAPNKVQYIYMMGMMKQPIGSSTYEDAIKEHPEYFPDEVEDRRKWDAIPQEIHDKYWEEYWEIDKEVMKDVPPSKGVIGWIDDQEGYNEWNKKWTKANEKAKPLRESLHKKFYSEYGIEWNGW
jgi:hypothetical protein